MRALYRLPNGKNCIYSNSNKSTATKLFDGLVTYEMDEQKSLTTVLVEVLNVNYEIKDNRFIISSSVEATAYKIALFIANKIYIQTGIDTVKPNDVLLNSPVLIPENETEENILKSYLFNGGSSVNGELIVRKNLNPCDYGKDYNISAAYAYYADALRSKNIITQYEQLYKIIEYFFDEEGLMLDNAVSRYISQFGPHFSVEKIKTLRWVRSRCIHPRAIHGHLNPEDINSVIIVAQHIGDLKKLSELLLRYPVQINP
jgi:hypothetical protein